MTKVSTISILLLFLFNAALARIKIVSPQELKDDLNNAEGYPFTMAKFGNIPYGTQQLGNIIIANPIDACSTLQPLAENTQNPILIIRRGECTFAVKARNAQNIGAKLVVIVDNQDEKLMKAFGSVNEPDIIVPTILIEKTVGDKIIDYIERNSQISGFVAPQISIKYPYAAYGDDRVYLRLWFSSADTTKSAYSFLREFGPIISTIPRTEFMPHYINWPCAECAATNFKTITPDCISGGRYCAPDPDSEGPLTGKDVIKEDLRQVCVFKSSPKIWWTYVDKFSVECLNNPEEGECGADLLDNIATVDEIDSVQKCYETSFESKGRLNIDLDDNRFLRSTSKLQADLQIANFPALTINFKQFNDKLDAKLVMNAVCESFMDAPDECRPYLIDSVSSYQSDYSNVFPIVLIMSFFTCIILFFYRRMVRREMSKEMSMQLSQMVSQYFTLDESQKMNRKELP